MESRMEQPMDSKATRMPIGPQIKRPVDPLKPMCSCYMMEQSIEHPNDSNQSHYHHVKLNIWLKLRQQRKRFD